MVAVFVAFIRVVYGRIIYMSLPESNGLFACIPCRGKQTFRPKPVLGQAQFACTISLIFLIFLKHNPPVS